MAKFSKYSLQQANIVPFMDYYVWNKSASVYQDDNSDGLINGQFLKTYLSGANIEFKTSDGVGISSPPDFDDLIRSEKERLAFAYKIDLKDDSIVTLDDDIDSGFEVISATALTSGDNVFTDNEASYEFSYAQVFVISHEELRSNSWFGTKYVSPYNGFNQLDPTTVNDSVYRENTLAWYRKDGGDPDPTNEDVPNKIMGSLGVIRLDGIEQMKNFKAIANTSGFDLAGKPHSLVVEIYIGRVPNF